MWFKRVSEATQMMTQHLPHITKLLMDRRDPSPADITRGVLDGAREFINSTDLKTTLYVDDDASEVRINVLDGHQNAARELAACLTHRFRMDVTRDGDTITFHTEELEPRGAL